MRTRRNCTPSDAVGVATISMKRTCCVNDDVKARKSVEEAIAI
jgi:hypothetical protein